MSCPMDETKAVLIAHAGRFPRMAPQDAVKLLYQNEFGPGHLISDSAQALCRLQRERSGLPYDSTVPPFEQIGNGLVRVSLSAWTEEEYPSEALNADFARSARAHHGTQAGFEAKLALLRDVTAQGVFSFSPEELEKYLSEYTAQGCPAVSHSDLYRREYRPAYRVVRRECLSLSPMTMILREIAFRKGDAHPLLVAIDGRCASGKTTLAAQLQQALNCPVIHMDDFFLRPEQRTPGRFETPGGNVDHERFLEEVLAPLSRGEPACWRPFDCSVQALGAPLRVDPAPVIVVEGSYSCHPALRGYYHLRLFVTAAPEVQAGRILRRDGAQYAQVFRDRWIPLEEAYFSACRVEECCQFSFVCGSAAGSSEDN